MTHRPRNERGAVAVMVGALSLVLFVIGAMAVDLGNLVSRRTWTQAQADHAALAGGSELDKAPVSGGTPSADVVAAVLEYLNTNAPQQDDDPCWRNTPVDCVVAADLTNGNATDGEVRYTALGLQVEAPHAWVQFGLANVIGASGGSVTGTATVQVKTGGLRVMPMYGVSGCDWGRQTLVDPANSPAPSVPTLSADADVNSTVLTAGSQVLTDSGGVTVETLTPFSTNNLLTFSASKFSATRKIGFFPSDGGAPIEQEAFWLASDTTRTDLSTADTTTYTSNPEKTVQALIPDIVAETEQVWWVRVFNQGSGKWSTKAQALPIRVGGAVLECASASNDGNFGTLRWPRTVPTQTAEHLPANVALGLQSPMTPTVHTMPSFSGECTHDVNLAVVSWGSYLRPQTNCVGTDPGVATTVLDKGLIKGGTGYPGLLTTAETKPGCDPQGGDAERSANFGPDHYTLNDEVLTCYLTDSTTSLADISSPTYSGGTVLDKSIYDSPRFFYVPVLKNDPGTGAQPQDSGHSIIDFRPAFLTDEVAVSTAVKGSQTGTSDNGVKIDSSGVVQMRVFFFNFDALPRESDSVIDYLGVGPRILRMVD